MAKMMRAGWAGLALLAATLSYAQTTAAPYDPFSTGKVEAGASKTAVCTACHGPNGNSANPEWPRLAGQSAVYIAEQLKLFKTQVRTNPVMMPMASGLSDQDVNDVAVYYQAQPLQGLEADPSYWQAGQALYNRGDRARNIPACAACHGPGGRGNPAAGYPALRAQQSVYVAKQLSDYASGARYPGAKNPAQPSRNGAMMLTIAKRLTPEDIRNVASYVQGLR
jgi:cytochrome c553